METQPIEFNRDDLAALQGINPRTIRAFENINLNQVVATEILNSIQESPIIGVVLSDVFTNDRRLAGSSDIQLTDGGPKSTISSSLTPTGVSAGSYGSASQTVQFAVDAKGRVSLVAQYALNTDNVTEGATNLFFTNARARSAISSGSGISYNSGTGVIAQALITDAGTYTPTLTSVSNVDATTAHTCLYQRIGSIVHVTGRLDIDPTTIGGSVKVGVSLPIASNLGSEYDLSGTINGLPSGYANCAGVIRGDTANDRAAIEFDAQVNSNTTYMFSFTYQII